jgi:hypothetical protein
MISSMKHRASLGNEACQPGACQLSDRLVGQKEVVMKETSTLDRIYLEWSQFTTARNFRELYMLDIIGKIHESTVMQSNLVCREIHELCHLVLDLEEKR